MVTLREVDKTEHLVLQGSNKFQYLEDIRKGPALQSSGAGIQPQEVQFESPFIGVGLGARCTWLLDSSMTPSFRANR